MLDPAVQDDKKNEETLLISLNIPCMQRILACEHVLLSSCTAAIGAGNHRSAYDTGGRGCV